MITDFQKIVDGDVSTLYEYSKSYDQTEKSIQTIVINNETRAIDLSALDSVDTVAIFSDGAFDLRFTISAVPTTISCNGHFQFNPTAGMLATLDSLEIIETNLVDVSVTILMWG